MMVEKSCESFLLQPLQQLASNSMMYMSLIFMLEPFIRSPIQQSNHKDNNCNSTLSDPHFVTNLVEKEKKDGERE